MFDLRDGYCFPRALMGVNVGLGCVDFIIAVCAFYQLGASGSAVFVSLQLFSFTSKVSVKRDSLFVLKILRLFIEIFGPLGGCILFEIQNIYHVPVIVYLASLLLRIQSRNSQAGWTRQKVFHLMIGSSSLGYFIYFLLTVVATCTGWNCWSYSCGFVFMAFPKILFFAAFLLLLSFWVDLCHQAKDDYEDEDGSFYESLLERTMNHPSTSRGDTPWRCLPFRFSRVGRRQKIVILVTMLVNILMIAAAVLIWIGIGKNPINSELVARVYVALIATAMLFLGGALACYGLVLCLKMRKIRSERAASEMWKVSGLALVSVLCFTTSSLIGLLTDIPLLYYWHPRLVNGLYVSTLVVLYYFIGSSVPSAFVLWVMRELPLVQPVHKPEESGIIAFIRESGGSVDVNQPQSWTTSVATSTQSGNQQITRPSPI